MNELDNNYLKPSRQQINNLLENFQARQYIDVEKLSISMTQEFPKHPFGWKVLAVVLKLTGRVGESLIPSQKAVLFNPKDFEAHNNLGIILQELEKLNEAEDSFRKAIILKPDYAEAQSNLGAMLQELKKLSEAEECCRQAIILKPDYAEAHYNLGIILKELGRLSAAEECYRQAIKLKPDYAEAYNNMGELLKQPGRLEEALVSYNKAIKININYSEAYSNRNLCLNYLSLWSPLFIYNQHLEYEKQFGSLKIESALNLPLKKISGERLRIGYVSADFKKHSVAFFFEPLLTNHNNHVVETFCYYNDTVIDATTKRLMKACDHWRSIFGVANQDAVSLIKNDKIDILVDLSGHTAGNCLLIFAQKPSPIQVTWLGYPNTTGLSTIDYRFTDIIADPIGEADNFHSETLFRLPNGFLCYQGNEKILVDVDLPQKKCEQITFGSFNNISKITPIVIKTWSKILHRVPKSRLVLKLPKLNSDTALYHELFNQEGIAKERVEFRKRSSSIEEHLNLYNTIDISLDSFPYNGATTTCEALWMGVPVITLLGDRHVGRVGASILSSVSLTDFITNDIDGYIELAVKISSNKNYLKELRVGLRERMQKSHLCNAFSFTKDIETAYQDIWHKYELKVIKE